MIMLKKSGFHKDIFEMIIDLLRKDEWDFSGKAFEIIKMKK